MNKRNAMELNETMMDSIDGGDWIQPKNRCRKDLMREEEFGTASRPFSPYGGASEKF